jgi:hypothetical protein
MTFPWGRRWLPLLWYLEVCVLGGALWALLGGGRPRDALAAAACLALCGAAGALPGAVLLVAADGLHLGRRGRGVLLHAYLAVAAGAVAATLSTGRAWGAAVAVLATGNAIWAIEIDARRAAQAGGGQTPAGKQDG